MWGRQVSGLCAGVLGQANVADAGSDTRLAPLGLNTRLGGTCNHCLGQMMTTHGPTRTTHGPPGTIGPTEDHPRANDDCLGQITSTQRPPRTIRPNEDCPRAT